jgi:hypothetical protein
VTSPDFFFQAIIGEIFGLVRRLQPLQKRFIVPMNCRGPAGMGALPGDVRSGSPILSTVLARGVRDARRSRPEARSTLNRIDAASVWVGPASRQSILASYLFSVAQTSKSAVARVSKPAGRDAGGRLGSRRHSRFGNLRYAKTIVRR